MPFECNMPKNAHTIDSSLPEPSFSPSLTPHTPAWRGLLGCLALLAISLTCGCGDKPPQPTREVIVYTALDEEFSHPLFDAFTRKTGIEVRAKFDTESTKTVNLVEAIRAERDRPRCDLFWNNEALHSLRLQREGLLRSYASPRAAEYPAEVQSPTGEWYGFAARARVLLVNTNLVPEARRPDSIEDLTDPQWGDRVGVAKPLFGTTATHAACLFAAWGDEKAEDFFTRLKRNARIMSGNKQVARAVSAGTMAFGLTDTDDAIIEIESGRPVAIVYPDQGEGQLGTLFIPNTLALMAGSANQAEANLLVDFLLSAEVEGRLAMGRSSQIPLNRGATEKPRVETHETVRPMQVDFAKVAEGWDAARKFLTEEFTASR